MGGSPYVHRGAIGVYIFTAEAFCPHTIPSEDQNSFGTGSADLSCQWRAWLISLLQEH